MAFSLSPLHQDLSCPICYEVYNDPVVPSCGHSFCRTCLQRSWTLSSERECPICRRRSSREDPPPDLALRKACESYLQQKKEEGSRSQDVLCFLHSEKLSMFCVDDEKLVCGKCVTQYHQNHSFCSINKAAKPHKETLQTHLTALEKKLQMFKNVREINDEVAAHIKSQYLQTEEQIKEEFEKLHQFLRTEEEVRISALRDEEEEKSQRMKRSLDELDKQIKEIRMRIKETENKLKDDASFLKVKYNLNLQYIQAQYSAPDPKPDSGALIDVAKHLQNLRYRVWERMKSYCPYYPVVLDPNTANPSLSISANLTSVSTSTEEHQLPDNPERMSGYKGVLGSEGFSSGTHSWVVDVGGSENWILGVAEESVSRKESCQAIPENGFYTIWRRENEIVAGMSDSGEKIATSPNIRRICVTFNWDKRQITFSNAENNRALYTFKHKFKKKMYPYFYNNSKNPLKLQPIQISITARI
ncbi:tripartite motif-containing protein 35-like [Astyanax mexicanus]|uniref:Tripartite motif-containing protein 35-like n=1 Tax=Astyanax mexicanus TaxID=7994 RepID=A0A8T2L0B8_ASTMX|nr:tripartite motif-containing protein 35-like [Astyanax mexicanus]